MAGLKINICFWYVDNTLIDEIVKRLAESNYSPEYCNCRDISKLKKSLSEEGKVDLLISDFDLPETLRDTIQDLHFKAAIHIPLIYLVGEKNELKAAETLKRGVWDVIRKNQFNKLVPTIVSSQKYGKVLKYSRNVESELQESESKYLSIFNNVKDGIIHIEPDSMRVVDINESVCKIFGFEPDIDKSLVIEWLITGNKSFSRDELEKVRNDITEEGPVSYLIQNEKVSGEVFWSENTLSQFAVGDTFQYIMVIRNIQEQKMMEDSLQLSREHFKNLAENSPDVIMRFNRSHRHLYVNETINEVIGIPVEEFINKTHEEMGVFPEHLVKYWEDCLNRVFESKVPERVEFDVDADGQTISFEWRLFPEFDEESKVKTVLAIARDITSEKLASVTMEENEKRLQLAVEATSLGLWDWKLENDEVYFSPIYFKMLGYEQDELPQNLNTWINLMHPDDRSRVTLEVEKCINAAAESFELEFRMLCKDESYKWICGRGRASEIEDGAVKRLIGTHEDISQRKHNQDIHDTLFNISNAVNTTKNLDELYESIRVYLHNIIDTTNCFLAMYHEESNMLTLPFHRDEVDSFAEFPAGKTLTGYVISTGKAQLVDAKRERELTEQGYIEPVGAPCVSWLGVPLKTDSKTLGVFVVQSYSEEIVYTQNDVAILEFVSGQIALAIERKIDQDNVKESQEKQRRIFESSPDPIIVVNPQGSVMDYNTSLLSVLNISNEPVIGQNVFFFISKEDRFKALIDFRRTWKEGYIKNMEYRVKRADESIFECEVSTGAIYTNEGEPDSMVIIFKDISDRKLAERNLLEAKEKAEESDKLKTAFLSNMSHEIRTPMNAIVGFSDLLNDPNIEAKERSEFIAQINLGADNLMHLIDDIIDIAKIEAGQIKINKQECNIYKVLEDQMSMFKQNFERMDKTDIDFRMNWNWPGKSLVLMTDHFRLKQIITNLLNNAIKFTDSGHIELGVEAAKRTDMIRFYVEDTGIGISKDKLRVIFDRFIQGHKPKTKLYGGTGLGLAISKNLTGLLGGEIGVDSTLNKGSRFWFELPLDIIESKLLPEDTADYQFDTNWSGKSILVAEDDDSNYILVNEVLRKTGAKVYRARDGNETIDLFDNYNGELNLVLMDIQMPERDGYECTRIIKEKEPNLPVIAQTAYAMSGERELSREAGCDDYISKPIHLQTLIEMLSKYLS